MTPTHSIPPAALARLHASLPRNLQRALEGTRAPGKDGLPPSVQQALAGQAAAVRAEAPVKPAGASSDHSMLSASARAALRQDYERWLRAGLGLGEIDLMRVVPEFDGDVFRLRERASGRLYLFRPRGELALLGGPTEEIGGDGGRWLCECFRFYLSLAESAPAGTSPVPAIGDERHAVSGRTPLGEVQARQVMHADTDTSESTEASVEEGDEACEAEPQASEDPSWPWAPAADTYDGAFTGDGPWSAPSSDTPEQPAGPGYAPRSVPVRRSAARVSSRGNGGKRGRMAPVRNMLVARVAAWALRVVRLRWQWRVMRLARIWQQVRSVHFRKTVQSEHDIERLRRR